MTLSVRGKGGAVERTYTAETYDLMYGTMEDVLAAVDIEAFASANDAGSGAVAVAGAKAVAGSMNQIKPLLMDIFPGLTEEEVRRVPVKEIVNCVVNVVLYTMDQVMSFAGGGSKNK